jgi:hypothetical protein
MTETARPSPFELWQQAGGYGDRYRELMREHGHLLSPGDEGCEASRNLPCGWPGGNGGMAYINPFGPIAAHLRGLPVGWPEEDSDFAGELDREG